MTHPGREAIGRLAVLSRDQPSSTTVNHILDYIVLLETKNQDLETAMMLMKQLYETEQATVLEQEQEVHRLIAKVDSLEKWATKQEQIADECREEAKQHAREKIQLQDELQALKKGTDQ